MTDWSRNLRERLRIPPVPKIFHETWRAMHEAQLFLVASSLSYTTLLSLVPVLAVSFSIFKAFGGLEKIYGALEPFIIENLAEGADEQAIGFLRASIGNVHAGAMGATGLVALIFTSVNMLSSVENAINRVWKAENRKGWFQKFASYWVFITLGPLGFAFALGVAGTQNVPFFKILPGGTLIFLLTCAALIFIYKYVPNKKVNWTPAIIGGLTTGVIWNFARMGYGIYTSKFVSYQDIYGSVAAVPILLLWIYIIWLIFLTGAALTSALQSRRGA